LTPPMSEDPNILAALDQIGANYVKIIAGEKIINSNGLTVLVNDQRGAVEITQHLIDLGHKHIAFLSGDLQHESTKERLLGFKKALKNNSLTLNTDWVLEGEYSFESGLAGANKLITMAKRPTAIVACNDEIAAGALFAARLAGLDIPTELSIVGFEDSPFSRQTWPKLTTVHQPNIEIAQIATQLLIDKRKNQTTETFRCFTPTPVIRNSTTSPT
ncbi:substrate-binding domain-containing protein, partial [Shewanella sp. CG_4_9_14_0_8_um_filter_42_14]